MMPPGAGRPPDPGVRRRHPEAGRDETAWRYEPDRRNLRLRHPLSARNPHPSALGPQLAEVTNAIVRLQRRHYGKGPTRSKSFLLDDVLVCISRDVLTTVERTLVEAGEHSKVRETRLAYEDAMRERFVAEVERVLERRVLGFSSQVLVTRDVAIEMFVLEPVSSPEE
jgi:uncharacterized protein YbcI